MNEQIGVRTQMQWVGEVKKRKCLGVFNRLRGHKPCGHSCSHTCLLFLSSPPVCVNDSLTLERKVIKAEFHSQSVCSASPDLLHRNPLCALSNSLSLTFVQQKWSNLKADGSDSESNSVFDTCASDMKYLFFLNILVF